MFVHEIPIKYNFYLKYNNIRNNRAKNEKIMSGYDINFFFAIVFQ